MGYVDHKTTDLYRAYVAAEAAWNEVPASMTLLADLEVAEAAYWLAVSQVFAQLDPAYRSHSKVMIGVAGLPKRVILNNVGSYGSYGRDRLRDILNALAAYRGQPLLTHAELSLLDKDGDALRVTTEQPDPFQSAHVKDVKMIRTIGRDVWLKRYANGNGHLYFGPSALLDINRGLAEFYGNVLPDAEEEYPQPRASTEVAKDLQFYWTPDKVISRALSEVGLTNMRDWGRNRAPEPLSVLEPSCGDGRIMDMVKAYGHRCVGIEYHAGRAAQARAKGHAAHTANFLEVKPFPYFDVVVMNPPFYGRHYVKHVRHAMKFLKPGGRLVAILPATAHYDHASALEDLRGRWEDLPVASFAEAGTNVPTGLLLVRKA